MVARLLITMFLLAPGAHCAPPQECVNAAHFDTLAGRLGQPRSYLNACQDALSALSAADAKVKSANPRMDAVTVQGNTQYGLVQGVSDLNGAASANNAQKEQIARQAAAEYQKVADDLKGQLKKFYSDQTLAQKVPTAQQQDFNKLLRAAYDDLNGVRDRAIQQSAVALQFAQQFHRKAAGFRAGADQTRLSADQLKGGKKSGGVGAGTWVALGGGALIAAGVVGGTAYFGNKALNKVDKISETRINQAEQSAKDVIKEAEESAKRIIQFASDEASNVILNAEAASKRIMQDAKTNVNELVTKLKTEVSGEFPFLSEAGVEKMRSEMGSIFDSLIAKAVSSGDTELQAKLEKTRDGVLGAIDEEIAKRKKASVTSTATSTATGTATSAGTTSASSTETSSSTATDTSTATGSSSSTSTVTAF